MSKHELGEYIKAERLKRKLTREEFAEKISISHSHLNNIERGNRIPSRDLLTAIAKELGVTSGYLLGMIEGHELTETEDNPAREEFTLWLYGHNPSDENLRKLRKIAEALLDENEPPPAKK